MADDELDQTDDTDDGGDIRQLREAAKRAGTERAGREAAEQETAALKRQVAFMGAGIDINDPKARYFVQGYDGDLTAEAIQAEATAIGVLAPPADATPQDQQTAWTRTQDTPVGGALGAPVPNILDELTAEGWSPERRSRDAGQMGERLAEILQRHGEEVSRHGPQLDSEGNPIFTPLAR